MAGDDPIRILDVDGSLADERAFHDLGLDEDKLRDLYRFLVLARRADVEAVALQRQGYLAVYGPAKGQEAASVGSAYALRPDDFIFPTYREIGAFVVRGAGISEFLMYFKGAWHGGEHDVLKHHIGLVTVPVATHIPHAVGWAYAARLEQRDSCALAYFGDGATSKGDFHEALNFAGVFRAPVIFFCQNNGWAISVPLARQTAGAIWRKGDGYGFPGVLVDGNDVLAVYRVTREAAERARNDHIPTLIEALTYRMGPHTTADDAGRYQPPQELEKWALVDPIRRYRRFLEQHGAADDDFFSEADREAEAFVTAVRKDVVDAPAKERTDLFEWVFENPSSGLLRQRREALAFWSDEEQGDGGA